MAVRVAINGFGRIGRVFFRMAQESPDIEIVGINDLGTTENLAYLLKYDSVYGRSAFSVSQDGDTLVVDGITIPVLHEPDPAKLPWGDMQVDVVVESTGVFTDPAKAQGHIDAGASRVVISAPSKGEPADAPTVLMGVNEDALKTCTISSNASCTTNAASPLIGILDAAVGIERAVLNTVHGYTASQALVDAPSKRDMRVGRAAAVNIVPTSTGAAKATALAHTNLTDKFDGIALRVPVVAGSIADVTFVASRPTTVEEVNEALRTAASEPQWQGVFAVTDESIVSSDIVGQPVGSIADLSMTRVVDGVLVKVLAWYDNEMGYAATLLRHTVAAGALPGNRD